MNTAVDSAEQDKLKAEDLIASIPLIPDVEKIDVELYTDHTGDPSFQLVFRVGQEVKVNEAFFDRFMPFAASVQTKILHSDLNRFPYTRLEQAA